MTKMAIQDVMIGNCDQRSRKARRASRHCWSSALRFSSVSRRCERRLRQYSSCVLRCCGEIGSACCCLRSDRRVCQAASSCLRCWRTTRRASRRLHSSCRRARLWALSEPFSSFCVLVKMMAHTFPKKNVLFLFQDKCVYAGNTGKNFQNALF